MLSIIMVALLTALFLLLGRSGMARLSRERSSLKPHTRLPLVSIIIPAYNAQDTVEIAIKSAKALDYPNKEILVVNDSDDRTPQIARPYGVRVIQNAKRLGKPAAMNLGVARTKGDILLFLDADTRISPDSLKHMVPWFTDERIAAVMPKYLLRNRGRIPSLADAESMMMLALLKAHLRLGSLGGFRGCCVALRRDVLEKHPVPDTLTEDNHLSGTLLKSGYRIILEPRAKAFTTEPETLAELNRQKRRWGEGALHAFRAHRGFYLTNIQFAVFFYPYFGLAIAASLGTLALLLSPFLAIPAAAVSTELLLLAVSVYFHNLILLRSSTGRIMPVRTLLFMLFYTPVMAYAYARGVLSGLKRRKSGKPELRYEHW